MQTTIYVSVDAPSGERLIVDGNLALFRELMAALASGEGERLTVKAKTGEPLPAVKTSSQKKGVKGHD